MIAIDNVRMNDGRRIVPGVGTAQRILNDRLAQKAIPVTAPHAFVNRLIQAPAHKMHFLADL